MKRLSSSLARPMAALKNHPAAAVLLAALALAFASASVPSPAMADEGDQTVTIYHFEMVHYDDPTFEDMGVPELTGMRLIGTSTVEGLKPGDVVRAWDHVGTHPGFRFFDGWPAEITVSEDPAKNAIQLNYFRQSSDVTVNYYEASLLSPHTSLPLHGDVVVETVGGQSVGFAKLGSEVRPSELYADVLEGDKLAEAVALRLESEREAEGVDGSDDLGWTDQELAYVGSYPESVFVSMDTAKNEINLVYTRPVSGPDHVELEDDAVALPDSVPAGDEGTTVPGGSIADDEPTGGPAGGIGESAPDQDAGSGGGSNSEGPANDDGPDDGTADGGASTQVTEKSDATESNRAAAEAAAEDGILTLPQTSDERGLVFAMILVASGAAAVIATAAFRKILR